MNELIACCGINCSGCEARIATVNNDDELRKITAEKWREIYKSPDLRPEMINCTGCRPAGVKYNFCSRCEIRNCSTGKGFETCGECVEISNCSIVSVVHNIVPEAIENLRS
jgi:hypothetical protein